MCLKSKILIVGSLALALGFTVLSLSLVSAKSKERVLESRINALELQIAYSSIATMPALKVDISHYKDNHTRRLDTYDNLIDVGNKMINERLTEVIHQNRATNFVCPDYDLEIDIYEEKNTATVYIHWPESTEIFQIEL